MDVTASSQWRELIGTPRPAHLRELFGDRGPTAVVLDCGAGVTAFWACAGAAALASGIAATPSRPRAATRSRRLIASHDPRKAPWVSIASLAGT